MVQQDVSLKVRKCKRLGGSKIVHEHRALVCVARVAPSRPWRKASSPHIPSKDGLLLLIHRSTASAGRPQNVIERSLDLHRARGAGHAATRPQLCFGGTLGTSKWRTLRVTHRRDFSSTCMTSQDQGPAEKAALWLQVASHHLPEKAAQVAGLSVCRRQDED